MAMMVLSLDERWKLVSLSPISMKRVMQFYEKQTPDLHMRARTGRIRISNLKHRARSAG